MRGGDRADYYFKAVNGQNYRQAVLDKVAEYENGNTSFVDELIKAFPRNGVVQSLASEFSRGKAETMMGHRPDYLSNDDYLILEVFTNTGLLKLFDPQTYNILKSKIPDIITEFERVVSK